MIWWMHSLTHKKQDTPTHTYWQHPSSPRLTWAYSGSLGLNRAYLDAALTWAHPSSPKLTRADLASPGLGWAHLCSPRLTRVHPGPFKLSLELAEAHPGAAGLTRAHPGSLGLTRAHAGYPGSPGITCAPPCSPVLTRAPQGSPGITQAHLGSPGLTGSVHPGSPKLTQAHPCVQRYSSCTSADPRSDFRAELQSYTGFDPSNDIMFCLHYGHAISLILHGFVKHLLK